MDKVYIGMQVSILHGPEYDGKFTGQIGTVRNTANGSDGMGRVGVQFEGANNPASGKGLFWFGADHVARYVPRSSGPLGFQIPIGELEMVTASKPVRRHRSDNQLPFPDVKRVIYNGPKTIILWADGTKTIVSCGEDENYDYYTGFCAAVVKKLFGSTSHAKKVLGRVIQID